MLKNRAERRHPFSERRRNYQVMVYDLMVNPMFIEGVIQAAWDESTIEGDDRWYDYTRCWDFPDPWWDGGGNWTDTYELVQQYAP